MPDDSILIIGASRASSEAEQTLSSQSFRVSTVESLSEAAARFQSERHEVVVLDTDAVAEPPWQAFEHLRERHPGSAILLMVTPDTPWSSFSSYRQRPAGLVLKPLDRTALLMAVQRPVLRHPR